MKKLKCLLLILIILFIPKVSASTNTYSRNSVKNYGVNKHWTIDKSNINYVLETPLVDANELIYDFSDILTEQQEQEYYELFKKFKEKYNIDIVFLSYNLPYHIDSRNEEFATDFYDFNDFGIDFKSYSGVLLFRNTYEQDPYYDMYSFGEAQLYYNSDRMSDILDELYNSIHYGHYSDALTDWLKLLEKYHDQGKIKGYYVDENSYLRKEPDPFNPQILPITIIDIIITAIFIGIKVKKNKMVYKATNADLYLNNSSFKLLDKKDTLVSTHTTSWTESDSSSSGGSGGGGSFSSGGHSGGGHSSGGGRHG